MVYAFDPADGAALVFAGTAREARKLGWPTVTVWTGCDYIDVRAKRITTPSVLALVQLDTPHVIRNPPSCSDCYMWTGEIVDGVCNICRETQTKETYDDDD